MLFVMCQKVKQLNYAWGLWKIELNMRRFQIDEVNCYEGHQNGSKAHFMNFLKVFETYHMDLKIYFINF